MRGAHAAPAQPVALLRQVHKSFRRGTETIEVFRDLDLAVHEGEILAVDGRSGAGKTTLLRLLAGLTVPDSGSATVGGAPADEAALADRVAVVPQTLDLLDALTAEENVDLALQIRQVPAVERASRTAAALDAVGLTEAARQWPEELSGGQQQRVALARALVVRPALLLADEPTAQLDSGNAAIVMGLLRELASSARTAMVVPTNDPIVLDGADRVVELRGGRLSARA